MTTPRTLARAAEALRTFPGMEERAKYYEHLAAKDPATFTGVTGVQTQQPADTSNYVKLASGEWVPKDSYASLTPFAQQKLNEMGVEQFNAFYQATLDSLLSGEIYKAAARQYVVETPSPEDPSRILPWNLTTDESIVTSTNLMHPDWFVPVPGDQNEGVWVEKKVWDSLSSEEKQWVEQNNIHQYDEHMMAEWQEALQSWLQTQRETATAAEKEALALFPTDTMEGLQRLGSGEWVDRESAWALPEVIQGKTPEEQEEWLKTPEGRLWEEGRSILFSQGIAAYERWVADKEKQAKQYSAALAEMKPYIDHVHEGDIDWIAAINAGVSDETLSHLGLSSAQIGAMRTQAKVFKDMAPFTKQTPDGPEYDIVGALAAGKVDPKEVAIAFGLDVAAMDKLQQLAKVHKKLGGRDVHWGIERGVLTGADLHTLGVVNTRKEGDEYVKVVTSLKDFKEKDGYLIGKAIDTGAITEKQAELLFDTKVVSQAVKDWAVFKAGLKVSQETVATLEGLKGYENKDGEFDVVGLANAINDGKVTAPELRAAGFEPEAVREATRLYAEAKTKGRSIEATAGVLQPKGFGQSLWWGLTPWKEEYGETVGSAGARGIAQNLSTMTLEMVVPGVYSARRWGEMGTLGRAISVGTDLLFVIPALGWVGKTGSVSAKTLSTVGKGGRATQAAMSMGRVPIDLTKGMVTFPKTLLWDLPKGMVTKPLSTVGKVGTGLKGFAEISVFPIRHPLKTAGVFKGIATGKVQFGNVIPEHTLVTAGRLGRTVPMRTTTGAPASVHFDPHYVPGATVEPPAKGRLGQVAETPGKAIQQVNRSLQQAEQMRLLKNHQAKYDQLVKQGKIKTQHQLAKEAFEAGKVTQAQWDEVQRLRGAWNAMPKWKQDLLPAWNPDSVPDFWQWVRNNPIPKPDVLTLGKPPKADPTDAVVKKMTDLIQRGKVKATIFADEAAFQKIYGKLSPKERARIHVESIQQAINSYGYDSAIDLYGRRAVKLVEPKALEYAKIERNIRKIMKPEHQRIRTKAMSKAEDIYKAIVEEGGVSRLYPQGQKLKRWQVVGELASLKNPEVRVMPGGAWEIMPTQPLATIHNVLDPSSRGPNLVYPFYVSDGTYMSDVLDTQMGAYTAYGESGHKTKITTQYPSPIDEIMRKEPVKEMLEVIEGGIVTFESDPEGFYVRAGKLVPLKGMTNQERAERLVWAVQSVVRQQGYVAAFKQFGMLPVLAVYPYAIDMALAEEDRDISTDELIKELKEGISNYSADPDISKGAADKIIKALKGTLSRVEDGTAPFIVMQKHPATIPDIDAGRAGSPAVQTIQPGTKAQLVIGAQTEKGLNQFVEQLNVVPTSHQFRMAQYANAALPEIDVKTVTIPTPTIVSPTIADYPKPVRLEEEAPAKKPAPIPLPEPKPEPTPVPIPTPVPTPTPTPVPVPTPVPTPVPVPTRPGKVPPPKIPPPKSKAGEAKRRTYPKGAIGWNQGKLKHQGKLKDVWIVIWPPYTDKEKVYTFEKPSQAENVKTVDGPGSAYKSLMAIGSKNLPSEIKTSVGMMRVRITGGEKMAFTPKEKYRKPKKTTARAGTVRK